jgi:hypothetical protein
MGILLCERQSHLHANKKNKPGDRLRPKKREERESDRVLSANINKTQNKTEPQRCGILGVIIRPRRPV